MSVSVKEIFNVGGSGGGVHARDADDDEDHGDEDDDDGNSGKKQRGDGSGSAGGGCARDFRKAKQVILRPFTMAKKQILRNTRSATANAGTSGKMFGGVGRRGKGCFFCFTQPPTLESPAQSHASDPNDQNFSYEMLKAFIESNDFYSKDCNPHLDFDLTSRGIERTGV